MNSRNEFVGSQVVGQELVNEFVLLHHLHKPEPLFSHAAHCREHAHFGVRNTHVFLRPNVDDHLCEANSGASAADTS